MINQRLTQNIEINAVKRIVFSTEVVATDGGQEQRNRRWTYPRLEWDCQLPPQARSAVDYLAVRDLFQAAAGAFETFLFRDWDDAAAALAQFGVGDGVTTVFQLAKTYTAGGATFSRKITRPVSGGAAIYKAGVLQSSGVTVDYTTGRVTFAAAPAASAALTWSGGFDVPVRFHDDTLAMTGLTPDLGHIDSFTLIEVRE